MSICHLQSMFKFENEGKIAENPIISKNTLGQRNSSSTISKIAEIWKLQLMESLKAAEFFKVIVVSGVLLQNCDNSRLKV